jgi:hypothetical protein
MRARTGHIGPVGMNLRSAGGKAGDLGESILSQIRNRPKVLPSTHVSITPDFPIHGAQGRRVGGAALFGKSDSGTPGGSIWLQSGHPALFRHEYGHLVDGASGYPSRKLDFLAKNNTLRSEYFANKWALNDLSEGRHLPTIQQMGTNQAAFEAAGGKQTGSYGTALKEYKKAIEGLPPTRIGDVEISGSPFLGGYQRMSPEGRRAVRNWVSENQVQLKRQRFESSDVDQAGRSLHEYLQNPVV